ncbi:MAG: hypothetical protein HC803_10525 [Saprospiraceae bacterium]|nr:hypothetical protein [Saprospiraceae bacterium]
MKQNYNKSLSIRQTRPSFKMEKRHTGFEPNNNLFTKRKATFPAFLFAIAFFLFGGFVPPAAVGQVVVLDNTSIASVSIREVGYDAFNFIIVAAAAQFTTGTAISSEAISVDLVMDNAFGGPTSNNFMVQIWGESGGEPNQSSVIATLSGNTNPSTAGTYTYTGTATWSAGQSLFIVCTAPN